MKKVSKVLALLLLVCLSLGCMVSCTPPGCKHQNRTFVPAVSATCTTEGAVAHYHCPDCGKNFDRQSLEELASIAVEATGHNYGQLVAEVPATCTDEGVIAHYTCSDCGVNFNENKEVVETLVIEATGHNYGTLIPGTPAGCEEDGVVDHYHCDKCDRDFDSNKQEIADTTICASGHNYGDWHEQVKATCEAEGTKAHYHCDQCGNNFDQNKNVIDDIVIAKSNHNYVNGVCTVCETEAELIDYVAQLQFDASSTTKKTSATVKTFIDGDTVHFNVDPSIATGGLLKARFLGVDTPESTGRIEDYGKKASRFTKTTLSNAVEIKLESDDNNWNVDSTGGRYLVWIWYRTTANGQWRNLNVEILQNGLAVGSNTANNRYGTIALAALMQARTYKYNVHSGIADPEVYRGEAIEMDLKELRTNIDLYRDQVVAFEGVVVMNQSETVWVEEYDPETGIYFGITVYYGFGNSAGPLLEIGNRMRIVGSVQYWEAGGTYQISDVRYRPFVPDDPRNIQIISTGNTAAYQKVTGAQFNNTNVIATVVNPETGEEEFKKFSFGQLSLNSSIAMDGLYVQSVYTTTNETSSSIGAMTFTCKAPDGQIVYVRTEVLLDENGNVITADVYKNKTINVQGIVDYYDGDYQIKVVHQKYIQIVG